MHKVCVLFNENAVQKSFQIHVVNITFYKNINHNSKPAKQISSLTDEAVSRMEVIQEEAMDELV